MNPEAPRAPSQSLVQLIHNIKLVAFDFDGVFTSNTVYVDENGREMVRCCRSDGIGIQRLRLLGIQSVVISSEPNPVVARRCKKLRLPCFSNCSDKKATLTRVLGEHDLEWPDAAFVGNDINDLSCLQFVALPIAVHDAHPSIFPFVKYVTRTPGGMGAVREVCDLFEKVLSPKRPAAANEEANQS